MAIQRGAKETKGCRWKPKASKKTSRANQRDNIYLQALDQLPERMRCWYEMLSMPSLYVACHFQVTLRWVWPNSVLCPLQALAIPCFSFASIHNIKIYMYTNIRIYIYIHTYIWTYIYVYIYSIYTETETHTHTHATVNPRMYMRGVQRSRIKWCRVMLRRDNFLRTYSSKALSIFSECLLASQVLTSSLRFIELT